MNKKFLITALILAIIGLIVSIMLGKVGLAALSGAAGKSFCNINDSFNCDLVAQSKYAFHFGIPNFLYGIGYYFFLTVVTLICLISKKYKLKNFFVYLFWISIPSVIVSIYLFMVSHFIIESFCILCMSVYLVNIFLLLVAFMAEEFSIQSLFRKLVDDIRFYFASFKRTLLFVVLAFIGISTLMYFNSNPLFGKSLVEEQPENIEFEHMETTSGRLITGTNKVPEITILMFTDYQCHFCSLASFEIKKLLKNNPDVRLIFKDLPLDQSCNERLRRPFHNISCMASLHARCAAEQGKFWEYHDLLFQSQNGLSKELYNELAKNPNLKLDQKEIYNQGPYNNVLNLFAKSLNLNMKQFNQCVEDQRYIDNIKTDIDEAASLDIHGTPTFYFDGKRIDGYRKVEDYQKVIDEIRAERKKELEEYEKQLEQMQKKQEKNNKEKAIPAENE